MGEKSTYDVFVSYSHQDIDWVKEFLLPRLRLWRLNYVVDHEKFLPGDSLPTTINELIHASKHVIFVCTPNFIESEWCQEELETARDDDPSSIRKKAMPIVLNRQSVPELLEETIWCDLTENIYDETEWKKLCVAIGGHWRQEYKKIVTLVRDAIEAEFAAYKALPDIKLEILHPFFEKKSSAHARINNILVHHSRKKWIISNPENPSVAMLLDINVDQTDKNEYHAQTTEYWYLRWFSITMQKYVHIYNKTNKQLYIIKQLGEDFLINANIYPWNKSWLSTLKKWLAVK